MVDTVITFNASPLNDALEKMGIPIGSVRILLVPVTENDANFIDSLFGNEFVGNRSSRGSYGARNM
jgi:hypothetical protein